MPWKRLSSGMTVSPRLVGVPFRQRWSMLRTPAISGSRPSDYSCRWAWSRVRCIARFRLTIIGRVASTGLSHQAMQKSSHGHPRGDACAHPVPRGASLATSHRKGERRGFAIRFHTCDTGLPIGSHMRRAVSPTPPIWTHSRLSAASRSRNRSKASVSPTHARPAAPNAG